MINTEYFNVEIDEVSIDPDRPPFSDYKPDMEMIRRKAEKQEFDNLVVIGNGGSVTSFRAYMKALGKNTDKEAYIVTTMEPEYLSKLSSKLKPSNTLVMPISKSGETVGVIEALLHFMEKGFPVFAVTSDNEGALKKIVDRKDFDFIEHPDISGRFTGATETALVPAAFMGLDAKSIRKGAEKTYEKFEKENNNVAKKAAKILYAAEKEGIDKVFTPFYSTELFGFYPLFVQLMHETVCKKGKGQTFFGDIGPECQHHTIQRIFGGADDVVTMLFHLSQHKSTFLKVGKEFNGITVRGKSLTDFDGFELGNSLFSELKGVKEALKIDNKPLIDIELDKIGPSTCGELLAFMQYLAYYSAVLRGLNPFNQPDVEKSKEIGFQKRFKGD